MESNRNPQAALAVVPGHLVSTRQHKNCQKDCHDGEICHHFSTDSSSDTSLALSSDVSEVQVLATIATGLKAYCRPIELYNLISNRGGSTAAPLYLPRNLSFRRKSAGKRRHQCGGLPDIQNSNCTWGKLSISLDCCSGDSGLHYQLKKHVEEIPVHIALARNATLIQEQDDFPTSGSKSGSPQVLNFDCNTQHIRHVVPITTIKCNFEYAGGCPEPVVIDLQENVKDDAGRSDDILIFLIHGVSPPHLPKAKFKGTINKVTNRSANTGTGSSAEAFTQVLAATAPLAPFARAAKRTKVPLFDKMTITLQSAELSFFSREGEGEVGIIRLQKSTGSYPHKIDIQQQQQQQQPGMSLHMGITVMPPNDHTHLAHATMAASVPFTAAAGAVQQQNGDEWQGEGALYQPLISSPTGCHTVFHYWFNNNTQEKIEVVENGRCPFCLTKCGSSQGLGEHLAANHNEFMFRCSMGSGPNLLPRVDVHCAPALEGDLGESWESKAVGSWEEDPGFFHYSRKKRRKVSAAAAAATPPMDLTTEAFAPHCTPPDNVAAILCQGPALLPRSTVLPAAEAVEAGELQASEGSAPSRTTPSPPPPHADITCDASGLGEQSNGAAAMDAHHTGSHSAATDGEVVLPAVMSQTMIHDSQQQQGAAFKYHRPHRHHLHQASSSSVSPESAWVPPPHVARPYFHSCTGQVMSGDEVALGVDSEDEMDEHVACIEDRRLLEEFLDVMPVEKHLMHWWNSIGRRQRVIADGHLPWACEAFAQLHGAKIGSSPDLRRRFMLLLVKLWNFNFIDGPVLDRCLSLVDYIKKFLPAS